MIDIKLNIDGEKGLKDMFFKGDTFGHTTGKSIKLFRCVSCVSFNKL